MVLVFSLQQPPLLSPAPYGGPSSNINILGGPSPAPGSLYPPTPGGPMTPMTPATPEGSGITPQLQYVF